MASHMDKYMDGKFFNQVNSKDEFAMSECKGIRARRMLEFLVPILRPKKSTWVTITVVVTHKFQINPSSALN